MSNLPAETGLKSKSGLWTAWGILAAVAVLAGLLLPQLMSGEMALEKSRPKADAKDKANLEYTAPALPEAPSAQAMLARLAIGTVVVLGLCVVTLWGMKRWINPLAPANALSREMKLMETLPLGNRACLHLVHLGKQQVLVGVDATGIKSIMPMAGTFEEALADTGPEVPKEELLAFPLKSA